MDLGNGKLLNDNNIRIINFECLENRCLDRDDKSLVGN